MEYREILKRASELEATAQALQFDVDQLRLIVLLTNEPMGDSLARARFALEQARLALGGACMWAKQPPREEGGQP